MFIPDGSFQRDDAGQRFSKRTKQKLDCVVKAVAIARNILYDQAYDMLKDFGRQSGKPTYGTDKFLATKKWATQVTNTEDDFYYKLSGVLKKFPTGNYIVRIHGHAFALINGIVHDVTIPLSTSVVFSLWKIEPVKEISLEDI